MTIKEIIDNFGNKSKQEIVDYLSNFEWCSLAECYVDKEDCGNCCCENCSYYLDS